MSHNLNQKAPFVPRYIFSALIHDASDRHADSSLLYDTSENRSLSYADSLTLIEFASNRLAGSGFTKGDIVVSYCPLSLESVILCWACLYNGLVFLPVDHNWPAALLKQVLDETSPCLALTDDTRLSNLSTLYPAEKIIMSGRSGQTGRHSFYEWLEEGTDMPEKKDQDIDPDNPAVILYTSGSTGAPKGVVLSQHALCNSGKLVGEHFGWQESDAFLNLGDLHFMSGLRNTCIAPLHTGSSVVIARSNERNSVLHVFDLIHNLNIQYIGVAPTVIRQMNILFSEARKEQLSPLRAILCTGGPLVKDQLELFYKNYNIAVYNYYGLTETAGICSGHNASTFSPHDNSIGKPVGAEFILIPEAAYDDPHIGELLVKSDNLMSGYYKREKETAEVLKDGCFYTGDIVQKRADGCFELLGRKKNTIKNIYSELIHLEEIDNALEVHPMIREACACSYAHHAEDERIVAFIVPSEYPANAETSFIQDLKDHMYKVVGKNRSPWCYFIEEDLPRNTFGKVERQKLTEKLYAVIQSEHTRYF